MSEEMDVSEQRELETYDDADVQLCTVGGVSHDWRPHTVDYSHFGSGRTYWRCVWCHGVTCGDYGEHDPCWLPYHHRSSHRSRAGVVWPLGGDA